MRSEDEPPRSYIAMAPHVGLGIDIFVGAQEGLLIEMRGSRRLGHPDLVPEAWSVTLEVGWFIWSL